MDKEAEKSSILKFTEKGRSSVVDVVAKEYPLTITLNNQELVTLLCSLKDLKYVAVGFLSSEGLLRDREEIKKMIVDNERGLVRLETVECKEYTQDVLVKRIISSGRGNGGSFYSAAGAATQHTTTYER